MRLFEDHAFLLFTSLALVLLCYTIITVDGKTIDERIIGTIAVALAGALAGFAHSRTPPK